MLESILLGHNRITSLNNSFSSNLKHLNFLNLSHNLLTEVSFQDIIGLRNLTSLDLSHNKIISLNGPNAVSYKQNYSNSLEILY